MKFKLHTYDIQDVVIALIMLKSDNVITEEDKQRLTDIFSEMNKLCTEENDYTVEVTIN